MMQFSSMKFIIFPALCLFHALVSAVDQNQQPCMPTKHKEAHNTFMHRHVHSGAPESTDRDTWMAFLKNNSFCNRPVQSFFPYHDRKRINDVCLHSGGKIYRHNLCISKENFSFITLTVHNETCQILNIVNESKHIILACEKFQELCQPVHFQKNPEGCVPKDGAPDCPGTSSASHSNRRVVKIFILLLTFLCPALL